MPARRSRTQRWRSCLEEIQSRGGAIDVAIARHGDAVNRQLVWRVGLLEVGSRELVIEEPLAMGTPIRLHDGVELVGIMSIGQNRWTFSTEVLGRTEAERRPGRRVSAYRLALPDAVARCQRRDFHRLSTAGLEMPEIGVWPLLDPRSTVLAERTMAELAAEAARGGTPDLARLDAPEVRPELGPGCSTTMLNIGGGGVGLRVPPDQSQVVNRHRHFWLRLDFPDATRLPVLAAAKMAHTHLQNDQSIYAGLSFEFSHNAEHRTLVVQQISDFVGDQQRLQVDERAAERREAA